ncbi:MAG: hypothetical protein ACQEQ8_08000 [Pseudomonadota bacterium]
MITELLVSGLTDELSTKKVWLGTRIDQLSKPLNQIIIADRVQLSGNWDDLGQRKVIIDKVALSGAQLTIAYYGAGQSNLHHLLNKLKALNKTTYRQASMTEDFISWQVESLRFADVTINLFDRGKPIASVHVPEFFLDNINHSGSTNQQVKALLFPIIDQLIAQWKDDKQNLQIDAPAVMRFLMRETLAYKL